MLVFFDGVLWGREAVGLMDDKRASSRFCLTVWHEGAYKIKRYVDKNSRGYRL
ncbi:hypothetical protein [Bartonella gabonensis]|uniref:hypothetical protein n=1 Tax=Bartonella gabonensis TaxID=2699889 RepID=UPI00158CE71A|nr:hypothetical protein [Bartonella gabonensis]